MEGRPAPSQWIASLIRITTLAAVLALISCTTPSTPRSSPVGDNYLRYVAFKVRGGSEDVLLRWRKSDMPLKIYLHSPPAGQFENPQALVDVVRDGITDWTDVAGPGVPSFEFVDDQGDADIPIVWEAEPSGDWYIAHCVYRIHDRQAKFNVERILMTAKQRQGVPATLEDVYLTMLHEMGHALGLRHSPERTDVMYKGGHWYVERPELSARDRETLRLLYDRPAGSRMGGARTAGP